MDFARIVDTYMYKEHFPDCMKFGVYCNKVLPFYAKYRLTKETSSNGSRVDALLVGTTTSLGL